uniref:Transferrin-like domain-containing protein n=1 Tax=Anolis carolinensis TaxID=28377 RepID=H9GMM1_ANOCA
MTELAKPHLNIPCLRKPCDTHGGIISCNSNRFEMFSSSVYKGKDLIFKDATRAIVPVGERTTAEAWLGRSFLEAMEGWEAFPSSSPECSRAGEAPAPLTHPSCRTSPDLHPQVLLSLRGPRHPPPPAV